MTFHRLLLALGAAFALAPISSFAQSHAEIVDATPCLYEYRAWYFSFRRPATFPVPNEFRPEQCDIAAATHKRLMEERAAADEAMGKETGPRDDDERSTACLLEYRVWSTRRTADQSFDEALRSYAPFLVQGKKQCEEARRADASIEATDAAARAQSESDDRRRATAEARAAEAQRRKTADQKAARDAQAAKPGVRIGMTEREVINGTNWGRPLERRRTTTAGGTREQWIYGSGNYLYFDNGRLTAIQD